MTIEEFVKDIGFPENGKMVDGKYIINFDNSNDYSKAYTKLDKYEGADLDPEDMVLSDTSSVMVYLTDDFDITLKADFVKDVYTLIIEEAKY